jgi:hypothetical protein
MTKGVWRLVGIFLLSTYFTLLYHLMSTISSGIYYFEHFVLDSMVVYNDLVLIFCFCWFCLVSPNCYSVLALDFVSSLLIVIPCLPLILSCLSELLFYSYPSLFLVSPNCYSVLALDFVLSLLIVIHSMLLPDFICISELLFRAYHWSCLVYRNVILCFSLHLSSLS